MPEIVPLSVENHSPREIDLEAKRHHMQGIIERKWTEAKYERVVYGRPRNDKKVEWKLE